MTMGGDGFVTHMYIAVPFKGGFPTKRVRGTVMRALDALNLMPLPEPQAHHDHGPAGTGTPGPQAPSLSRRFKFNPLMPVALAPYACTRWEDIEPQHLLYSVKWYVTMRVDAGSRLWFRATDEAYGCGLDRLNASYRRFEALMAAAPASLIAHVDVTKIRIRSCVDLTSHFQHYQTCEEEEEEADALEAELPSGSEPGGSEPESASGSGSGVPLPPSPDDSETDARIFRYRGEDMDYDTDYHDSDSSK